MVYGDSDVTGEGVKTLNRSSSIANIKEAFQLLIVNCNIEKSNQNSLPIREVHCDRRTMRGYLNS